MLSEALAFPRNRDGALRDLLIGGLLVLASGLVVPGLLVYGYLLEVMNAGARGHDRPPAFGSWGRLLAGGLRAVVVVVLYGVVPLALPVAGVAATAVAVLPRPALEGLLAGSIQQLTHRQLALFGGVGLVLLLAAVVLLLHLPAALVAVGTQGRLAAAFRTDALWSIVNTGAYLKGLFLAAVVWLAGSLVALPLVPVLVGFVVQFYVLVVVAYLLGRAVGGAAVTAIRPA